MCYHLISFDHEDGVKAANMIGAIHQQMLNQCELVDVMSSRVACPMPIDSVYHHLTQPSVKMVVVTNDDNGNRREWKRSDGTAARFISDYETEKQRLLVLESKKIGAKVTRKRRKAAVTK